eukprot:m.747050 g.747050  ORF g.747050 m.747050 type:complete len:59 (+) comp23143_c0_seq1:742-918(+)
MHGRHVVQRSVGQSQHLVSPTPMPPGLHLQQKLSSALKHGVVRNGYVRNIPTFASTAC